MKTESRLNYYIFFDEKFYLYMYGTLSFVKDKAVWAMGEYNFTKAEIRLRSTDETIVTLEKE